MQKLKVEYATFVRGTCHLMIMLFLLDVLQRNNTGEAGRIYGLQGTLRVSGFQGRDSSERLYGAYTPRDRVGIVGSYSSLKISILSNRFIDC